MFEDIPMITMIEYKFTVIEEEIDVNITNGVNETMTPELNNTTSMNTSEVEFHRGLLCSIIPIECKFQL